MFNEKNMFIFMYIFFAIVLVGSIYLYQKTEQYSLFGNNKDAKAANIAIDGDTTVIEGGTATATVNGKKVTVDGGKTVTTGGTTTTKAEGKTTTTTNVGGTTTIIAPNGNITTTTGGTTVTVITGGVTKDNGKTTTIVGGSTMTTTTGSTTTVTPTITPPTGTSPATTGSTATGGTTTPPTATVTYILPSAYNAVGNGTTNDSKAIQDMINKVSSGALISLNGKTYNLGGQRINITKSITILGAGSFVNGQVYISNVSNVTLKNIVNDNINFEVSNIDSVTFESNTFRNVTADVNGFIGVSGDINNFNVTGNVFSNIKYINYETTYGTGIKFNLFNTNVTNVTIKNNTFSNIYGPAAIWIGGNGSKINNLLISNNTIDQTRSFGIEVYQYDGNLTFENTIISDNRITNIGVLRVETYGNGSGGVYSNVIPGKIIVKNNYIKNVAEVGIEGCYASVSGNYIEDTGADQLNHPIMDSAGIYTTCGTITGNTIVNPGSYGGIHGFSFGIIDNINVTNNVIKNVFSYWKSNSKYALGDVIVSNGKWYVCKTAGTSGSIAPSTENGGIKDGTAVWNYKKPFPSQAILFNAVNGVSNMDITGNTAIDFASFVYLSGYISNINITGNHFLTSTLIGSDLKFITGYGSRSGSNIVITNN